jgi:hypothetical protein
MSPIPVDPAAYARCRTEVERAKRLVARMRAAGATAEQLKFPNLRGGYDYDADTPEARHQNQRRSFNFRVGELLDGRAWHPWNVEQLLDALVTPPHTSEDHLKHGYAFEFITTRYQTLPAFEDRDRGETGAWWNARWPQCNYYYESHACAVDWLGPLNDVFEERLEQLEAATWRAQRERS